MEKLMKSSYLRAGVALACALALSACGGGGGGGQFTLSGTVYGATKNGLILQNNGGSDLAIPASTAPQPFVFPDLLRVDAEYNVTVKANSIPPNAEKCEVSAGRGRASFSVSNVQVICTLKTHALGGTITGLGNAGGLVLVNGPERVDIAAGATTFDMLKVGEDSPYGITVLTNPVGLQCTVANGTGTMGTTNITNVAVSCVPA
jgi:hypothetical protein